MTTTASGARTATLAPAAAASIPGPSGHPLAGMATALRRDLLGTLTDGFARYGDVVAYPIGPPRGPRRLRRLVVALHHPDDVRRVLTDAETFARCTTSFEVVRELFGTNLVTADGADWQRQKRLLQPLFTRAAVDRFAAVVEQEAVAVAEQLSRQGVCTIDALRMTERYSLRVLGRTLFNDGERGIDEATVAALERLVPVISRQIPARARQVLRLPLRWPTPRNRRFAQTRDALHATIERVLADAGTSGLGQSGLLTRLRDADGPEGGQPPSPEEVREQAMMFLIAGYSTTSNALCATLHLLGRHPQVQEQVAATGGERMARAAMQEGLRLHPPSYVLGRRVGPSGADVHGRALAPGTDVLVSPWITHRHPAFWSDPERFDPWRFAGDDARPLHAWLPFGVGARACIGRHLSLLESAAFVRALLARVRLESLDARMPLEQVSTLRPSQPVRITCRPR